MSQVPLQTRLQQTRRTHYPTPRMACPAATIAGELQVNPIDSPQRNIHESHLDMVYDPKTAPAGLHAATPAAFRSTAGRPKSSTNSARGLMSNVAW